MTGQESWKQGARIELAPIPPSQKPEQVDITPKVGRLAQLDERDTRLLSKAKEFWSQGRDNRARPLTGAVSASHGLGLSPPADSGGVPDLSSQQVPESRSFPSADRFHDFPVVPWRRRFEPMVCQCGKCEDGPTFDCEVCKQPTPWCCGGNDSRCDDCWAENSPDDEPGALLGPWLT